MEKPGTGGRQVKLLCINDDGVRVMRDLGNDRHGEPSSQRQALSRMLREKLSIDGETVYAFALAEPPTKAWPGDEFDDNALKDNGGAWKTPSAKWLKIRAERIKARSADHEAQEARARVMASQNLATQLEKLAASAGVRQ